MILVESEPNDIRDYCRTVRQAGASKAPSMLAPFQRLNYARMDQDTVETVEDTLYFGVFGVDRPGSSSRWRNLNKSVFKSKHRWS